MVDLIAIPVSQDLENLTPAAKLWQMISVKHSGGEEWIVTVKDAVTTEHRVRLTKAVLQSLAEDQSGKAAGGKLQIFTGT